MKKTPIINPKHETWWNILAVIITLVLAHVIMECFWTPEDFQASPFTVYSQPKTK